MPDLLRALRRQQPEILRNGDPRAVSELAPAGVVVKSQRLVFTWQAPHGARSTVMIFRGEEEIMRSPALDATSWTPSRDLSRGGTYAWEVRIEIGETPGHPVAAGAESRAPHIVDAATFAELEAAQRPIRRTISCSDSSMRAQGLEAGRANICSAWTGEAIEVARSVLSEIEQWRR
jgi:hypothetical protein